MHGTSGFVENEGVRLHYVRTGGGKNTLLLLHGYTDDGSCWAPVARKLVRDFDLILPDARGHGRSDAPRDGYANRDQASDVLALIRALGLSDVRVVGHSMGAAVAGLAASLEPSLFVRVVLEDPPPARGRARDARTESAQRASIEAFHEQTREELSERCRKTQPGWSDEEIELWADSKSKVRPDVATRFGKASSPWWDELGRCTSPILLITGEARLGALVLEEDEGEFSRRWRRGSIVRLAGAGHSVHRDRFDDYMRVLQEFL